MILNDFSQIQDGRQKVNFFKFVQISNLVAIKCKKLQKFTRVHWYKSFTDRTSNKGGNRENPKIVPFSLKS